MAVWVWKRLRISASLSLKDGEDLVQRLQDELNIAGAQKMALCLAGRILSPDLINRDEFRSVISTIWKVDGDVEIEVITSNTYAFHFQFPHDKWKVLAGGLWSFDDALIVLEESTGKGALKSLKFIKAEFWDQISNIPILCMTKEIGRLLGNIIGDVREVDVGPYGDCLGHTICECSEVENNDQLRDWDLIYSVWLKAPVSPKQSVQRNWDGNTDTRRMNGNRRSYDVVEEA
ncbi:hypothetical protein Ddye_031474 [Dipteronia dyeriana]|uniref:DUF4283 domain-containing protein n=1 Tax=Dipteronia dyeriana TaxID=168575 RepID=A0AAD9TIG3_9ROSI|nr:hypothetical protein Ddye_031474 [Dipteronia dyeriana]